MSNEAIMTTIAERLQAVRTTISEAAEKAGRKPAAVSLIAVSKAQPASALQAAYDAGQRAFGENYLQEALQKQHTLAGLDIHWHFIGPIQSNKTQQIAQHFAWVHGVDRIKIAERLHNARPGNLPPLQVCIQVNVSGEDSKAGVEPNETLPLAQAIHDLPRLKLRGLMTIPAPTDSIELQRKQFRILAQLRDQLVHQGYALDTLSMGMSHDYVTAIEEGATMVRIGTAIFGARTQSIQVSDTIA